MNRRTFLNKASALGVALPAIPPAITVSKEDVQDVEMQSDRWSQIASNYPQDGYINLRSIWTGLPPKFAIDQYKSNVEALFSNDSDYLRYKGQTVFRKELKRAKTLTCSFFGCKPEELAFVRNTTEGLMNLIFGLPLKRGDEVLITDQEYSLVKGGLAQVAERNGIKVTTVQLPTSPKKISDLILPILNNVSKKTSAVFCCHVYLSGIVFPVKELKSKLDQSIVLAVDGALAVGQIDINLESLGCDFYAGSFHKAFGLPRGMGFLYMKQQHLSSVWPLYGSYNIFRREPGFKEASIRKFEKYGQFPDYHFSLLASIIDFYNDIGKHDIYARIHYLKQYWTQQLTDHAAITFVSPLQPKMSAGLVTFQVRGKSIMEVERRLADQRILVATTMVDPLEHEEPTKYIANVVFVNVNLFTLPEQLDRFVEVLDRILTS